MIYDFSIQALLKEGFKRTDGIKFTFFGAVVIYALISTLVNQILKSVFPYNESFLNIYAASIFEAILTIPILVGINMLAIKRAREETLTVPSILGYYNNIIQLTLAYIAMTALIATGFMLLVLPGIYLVVSYVFTYTLIVDKGLDIFEAMELSRKTVTKQWFKFFGLLLISGLILLVGAIPFGIGLIWAIPTVYISYGLLYHRLFDEE